MEKYFSHFWDVRILNGEKFVLVGNSEGFRDFPQFTSDFSRHDK